jgi:DNA (cytosine-5)-methyltransferase 1
MRHGSLFSGIGGFDLAAEWMGWENVFHCEWMEFPRKVLDYHFPDADSHIDICKTDFKKYANQIDILTGGFPCQPFSTAGKRKGTDDERYLWGEMLRAIQEIKPRFVIAENVFGITNIDGGLVFEQVCVDLETEGYEVQPFIIPAAAKNAPHRRDRCWFVAYAKNGRCGRRLCEGCANGEWELLQNEQTRSEMGCEIEGCCGIGNVTNTNSNGFDKCNIENEINTSQRRVNAFSNIESGDVYGHATNTTSTRGGENNGQGESRFNDQKSSPNNWDNFPSESPICSGDDGVPDKLDGITFPKWRQESIKGFGNAIVPQVAFEIFKAIQQCDESLL